MNTVTETASHTPPTLSEFLGTEQSPVIVHDPQLENRGMTERAQLRSLPLLMELGVSEFIYDDLWARDFQLVEHTHLDPTQIVASEIKFPVGHVVTSPQLLPRHQQEFEYEHISQADITWDLFRVAIAPESTNQYVVVTDTDSPEIPSRTPTKGRSAADQFNAVTFDYEDLIHDYVGTHVDSRLPLADTKNLYLHRVSEHHDRHDLPASEIPSLFDYDRAPADSPIWDPLHYFLEYELEELLDEYEAHVTTELRSWTEHGDTGKISKRMIATLHRCDFDRERLYEYQNDPDR